MTGIASTQVLKTNTNVHIKVKRGNAVVLQEDLHNTVTDDGIYSLIYSLVSPYSAQIKGIRFLCSDQTSYTFLISDANAPTEKVLNTGKNAAAEIKFYLDTSQLNGKTINEIQLTNTDSSGKDAIFSAVALDTPIAKTADDAVLVLWQITVQNATV